MSTQSDRLNGLLAIALMCSLPRAHAAPEQFIIDGTRTVVSFEVRNLGISRQRGTFRGAAGNVSLDPQAGGGQVDIVVDARSIQAAHEAVARFMRSKGLLNVEQFPEIVYRARRVVFANGKPDSIEGELTLLGVTRSVPLAVTVYGCTPAQAQVQRRCKMGATATFRRSEFGMTRFMAVTSDEVTLVIRTEGVRAE